MNFSNLCLFKRSNGIWYVGYYDSGRRRWKTTRARRKRDALLFLTEFKEALKPKPKRILFSEFIKDYAEIQGPNLRESTLNNIYIRSFNLFISICGDKDLANYTPRDVDVFKAKRLKSCSPTTVSIEFRSVKTAFNCAVRWEVLQSNPFAKCSLPRVPEKRPTCITPEEFLRLKNAAQEPLFKRLYELAVLTGMRLGEVENLEWKDVDLEKKVIAVSNTETFLTKTGKMRVVPMSDRVHELLTEMKAEENCAYVFNYEHRKLNRSYVDHKFRDYRRAAGLAEDVTFHSLRHTFATWLVQKGVPIFEVQKLLGHSDIKVTQIYSHLAASDLHSAVNKLKIEGDEIVRSALESPSKSD